MKHSLSAKSHSAPSATVQMHSLAASKKSAGEIVYNFAAGEPFIPNHPAVIAAVEKGMQRGPVTYAPLKGFPELRKGAVAWMNRRYRTIYRTEEAIVTTGGKFALFAALQALVDEGEEVLLAAPYWVSYPEMVRLCGGIPAVIQTEPTNSWKLTPELIRRQHTAKSKVLLLNNACNPTGALYSSRELEKILQTAAELGLFLISDEVYSELIYDGTFISCGAFPAFAASTIVVQSCSKNFAMTGWRVGFAFAPEKIVEAIALFQGHMTTGTSTASQWAAAAALEHADQIASKIRAEMLLRRDLCCRLLNELFEAEVFVPPSSLYLFLSLKQLHAAESRATDYCLRALKQGNVALVPGDAFGKEGYVRLSFSPSEEEISAGLQALKNIS